MKITTQLNVGQTGYTLFKHKIQAVTVESIKVEVTNDEKIIILYKINDIPSMPAAINEDKIFASKQDLVTKLLDDDA